MNYLKQNHDNYHVMEKISDMEKTHKSMIFNMKRTQLAHTEPIGGQGHSQNF